MGNTANATRSTTISFMTVDQFKHATNNTSFDIVTNPKTGKNFAAGSSGKNYKCQQAITTDKEIKVLIDNGNLDEACFTNTNPSGNIVVTL